jgi:hypothetical protein
MSLTYSTCGVVHIQKVDFPEKHVNYRRFCTLWTFFRNPVEEGNQNTPFHQRQAPSKFEITCIARYLSLAERSIM